MAQKYGQQKLDEINQKIIEAGLKPTSPVFLTQKEYLRNAIDECAATSNSFDEFQSKLLEQFQISVRHLAIYFESSEYSQSAFSYIIFPDK